MNSIWEPTPDEALRYLRAALPDTDLASCGPDFLESLVRRALRLRREAPWGRSVPREVFLPYVLFPRVNNEYLEDNSAIADQVFPLVRGLSMAEAALRVNLWCFEQATYRSTDDRTASPLAVMRAGFGRCGEESTLAVCALRAACLPARQVYVPRWAHTDDNHAWVEVWVDGAWHYLGACEPEPQLDTGWFTAAASRAMMVHTRCWGLQPPGERAEVQEEKSCLINRTQAYAPTCLVSVRTVRGSSAAPGTPVRFLLCNESELSPICEKRTDAQGLAELETGLGGLLVEAVCAGKRLLRQMDTRRQRQLTLDLDEASFVPPAPLAFSLAAPAETRLQTLFPTTEARSAHELAMLEALRRREKRLDMGEENDGFVRRSAGNAGEIRAFLKDGRFSKEDKQALLGSLSEKDLFDATASMLWDALEAALPFRPLFPREVWTAGVLCPRVAFEKRLPIRKKLQAFPGVSSLQSPQGVWRFVRAAAAVRPLVPGELYPDSLTALRSGFTSAMGQKVLFVDLCRALGLPARLSPAAFEPEYWEKGRFVPLLPAAKGALDLKEESGAALAWGERFTIARADAQGLRTLRLRGTALRGSLRLELDAGHYLLTCATRQIDGTVDGLCLPFTLEAGQTRTLSLTLPQDQSRQRLLFLDLPPLAAQDAAGAPLALSPRLASGRGGILAFIAPGEEPTEHFLLELRERRQEIIDKRLSVTLAADSQEALRHERLQGLDFVTLSVCRDAEGLLVWRKALHCGDIRKPLSIAVSRRGRALFAYANYHVGSVQSLLRIIALDETIKPFSP